MSTRKRVLELLNASACTFTATEIAKKLDAKISSVSSLLKKMVDAEQIERVEMIGPRGGSGYKRVSQNDE